MRAGLSVGLHVLYSRANKLNATFIVEKMCRWDVYNVILHKNRV